MFQRFFLFLSLLLLPFSGLMSSDLSVNDIQRKARHIIRGVIIANCEKEINSNAYVTYPAPDSGMNDKNEEARIIQILDKRSEVCLYVQQLYHVDSLNTKIIECLKGNFPDFIGYKTAFDDGKGALEKEGFFLDDNYNLCRKNN